MTSTSSRHIAMLAIHGTHYQVGFQLGTTFKQQCIEYYANCTNLVSYEEFYAGERGKSFCEELWKVGEHRFPHYMDELKGMSDGAGIPLSKVKLLLIERELQVELGMLEVMFSDNPPKGCSDILINTTDEVLIGHNEDWDSSMVNKDCLVIAHILPYETEDGRHFPEERLMVHTWPGMLMGLASGFNDHGLVYSIDHLYPKQTQAKHKTADLLLTRHLLSATSLDHAKQILLDQGWGAATGFCANIGFVGEDTLLNIEIGLNRVKPESLFSCAEIPPNDGKLMAHFNNFERLEVESYVLDHCLGRADCLQSLPQPTDISTLTQALGDYGCTKPSANIYQSPHAGFPWATLATVIYDVKRKRMLFYRESSRDTPPVLVIPFSIMQSL